MAKHFDSIPERHGMSNYGGRAGKPSGMGRFNKGDLVVIDTPHGPAKAVYNEYSSDRFSHNVTIRGPVEKIPDELVGRERYGHPVARIAGMIGQRHSVAGEDTKAIRPNRDPDDRAKDAAWQEHMSTQWRDRRGE